eukprot:scaffold16990_cov79-Cyclotella_meneghiniana.AAC.3
MLVSGAQAHGLSRSGVPQNGIRNQLHPLLIINHIIHITISAKGITNQSTPKKTSIVRRQETIFPSTSELREAARFEQASNRVSKRTTIRDHFAIAKEIAVARRTEKSIDEAVRESLRSGGVGSIPQEKGNNIRRFMFKNWDSLAPWKSCGKVDRINALCKRFDVDCILTNEVQVQWDIALAQDRTLSLERLLMPSAPPVNKSFCLLMPTATCKEQCQKILGHESPASHLSGSLPITGIFATSDILPKRFGIALLSIGQSYAVIGYPIAFP